MATTIQAGAHPAPQSQREKELAAIHRLKEKADGILEAFDESYFMKDRVPREYPKFDRSEVKFGPVLGVGGFGIVFEVNGFDLKIPQEVDIESFHEEEEPSKADISLDSEGGNPAASVEKVGTTTVSSASAKAIGTRRHVRSDGSQTTETSTVGNSDHVERKSCSQVKDPIPQDEVHYDVKNARRYMSENAWRNGDSRYAVKRLHRDLNDLERTRATIDLAIEAKFLATVWHPNIGMSCSKINGLESVACESFSQIAIYLFLTT